MTHACSCLEHAISAAVMRRVFYWAYFQIPQIPCYIICYTKYPFYFYALLSQIWNSWANNFPYIYHSFVQGMVLRSKIHDLIRVIWDFVNVWYYYKMRDILHFTYFYYIQIWNVSPGFGIPLENLESKSRVSILRF